MAGAKNSHGISQSSPIPPVSLKSQRHPNPATINPPHRVPKAGPTLAPKSITEFASPRRLSGKVATRMRELAGYATDSPSPNTNRRHRSAAKDTTMPLKNVASDHSRKPDVYTQRTSKRSTREPAQI